MQEKNIYKDMELDIEKANLDEETKQKLFKNVLNLKNQKVNLMITGATGCGKSSTINAMFNTEIAKVGVGVDPETMTIEKYTLDNLILWDSPGLGDGKEKDIQHSKGIIKKLNELDKDGKPLIDLVLVLLDGGSRDLGTSYELINQVIIPNLGENAKERILIAINKADTATTFRDWDFDNNKPKEKLVKFLEEKVESVKKRVKEATGVEIEPIYYSAGYKDEDESQRPYNLSKLLYFIVTNTPSEKRLAYVNSTSNNQEMWEDSDEIKDYNKEIKQSFLDSIQDNASKGADIGASVGSIFGKAGETIGRTVGAVAGAVWGGVKSIFGW